MKLEALEGPKPLHHSVTDWDFYYFDNWGATPFWQLYTPFYVSAPSCLDMRPAANGRNVYALSNLALTQDLKAGRIVDWLRRASGSLTKARIYIGVTGQGSVGIAIEPPQNIANFRHYRISWWQGYNLQNQPATIVTEEEEIAGDWIPNPIAYYAPLTGSVNRIGVGGKSGSFNRDNYHDDTEIWLPA